MTTAKKGESRRSKSGRQNHGMHAAGSKNNFVKKGYIASTVTPQDFTWVGLCWKGLKRHREISSRADPGTCCQLRTENIHISLTALVVGTHTGTSVTPC